jgi:hypothetical protein
MTNIRDRRAKRISKITKSDDLYEEAGVADLIVQEELDEDESDIIETVNYKRVQRRRTKPLVKSDYDYQTMAVEYSKENVAQQLGNYRQAMDFLTHINPPTKDKLTERLKDIIYSYPNVDISSFVNKENAKVYSWIIQQMTHAFGEKYLGAVYVLGGGIGILPAMMLDTTLRFETLRTFDINGVCQFIADEMMSAELLADWRFKATTADIFNIGYDEHTFTTQLQNGTLSDPFIEIPGTLINTNISYLLNYKDWYKMIPDMRRLVLLGETGDVPRPFASSQNFNKQFPMSFELYTGVITYGDKQYYLKIGYK